jgi:starvation-inducible DNA-binding protein
MSINNLNWRMKMANTDKVTDLNHNKKVAAKLQEFLADSYATLIQTQNLHWNIEGDNFFSVHKLTEEIYDEQFAAIDEIAERLRALGQKVEAGFDVFAKQSKIKNEPTLKAAIAAQEQAAKTATELADLADDADDIGTEDLAVARLKQHQKNAWMLKSQDK